MARYDLEKNLTAACNLRHALYHEVFPFWSQFASVKFCDCRHKAIHDSLSTNHTQEY